MIAWYAGPWIWDTSFPARPCWRPPAGLNGLDLRNLTDQAAAGGTPGLGVFFGPVAPAQLENRDDYKVIGSGSWYDIQPNAQQLAAIPRRIGFTPQGNDLCGILLSILTDGASPDGSDGPLPIAPTFDGRVELHAAQHHYENFRWGGGHTAILRQTLRRDFTAVWQRNQTLARKFLDMLCVKYGVSDWKEFVPVALQPNVPGRLPHDTTVTDDFNRADSSTIGNDSAGNAWSEQAGDWKIVSNQLTVVAAGIDMMLRDGTALSGADHYSQAAITYQASTNFAGVSVRWDSSVKTFYVSMATTGSSNNRKIWKVVSGSFTQLAVDSVTVGAETLTGYLEINGSSLKSTFKSTDLTITDTAITSKLQTGLNCFGNSPVAIWDNFQAADLGGGGGIIYTQLERGIRGYKRGVYSGGDR